MTEASEPAGARTRMPALWTVLPGLACLSLLTNRWPWLIVVLWGATAAVALVRPAPLAWGVAGVWGFWIVSFVLTSESMRVLGSFAFHRRDGQLFFSLLPLAVLASVPAAAGGARRWAALFCGVQAIVSLASAAAEAFGARDVLEGVSFLPDEGPGTLNYCALYAAHNAAGSVQGLCCLVALALACFEREKKARMLWAVLALPLMWGVLLSRSRGSLLALLIAGVFLAVLAVRERRLTARAWIGVATLLALTAVAFGASTTRRFAQFAKPGTHTGRWQWWKRAVEEWSWSPVVGIGMGRYNDEERRFTGVKHLYYVATEAKVVNAPNHAHNSYVHFLAEGGLVGFGLTVGFWGWVAWRLRGSREPLRIAAFLGVLFLFAISMTEHYMGGGAMLLVLSTLVGAAWSLPEPPPADRITPS